MRHHTMPEYDKERADSIQTQGISGFSSNDASNNETVKFLDYPRIYTDRIRVKNYMMIN
jgi:hypothetical protein